MPGRGSFGPAGKWIHDRAHHIMAKNPGMAKSIAYAVATQQAHKVGKSPRTFRTAEGVRAAMAKHVFPKKFYKKKAASADVALRRLKQLVKEAKAGQIGRRVVKFKSAPTTYRGATVSGAANYVRPQAQKHQLYVPKGHKAKKRGRIARAVFGGGPMKAVPTLGGRVRGAAGSVATAAALEAASRLRGAALRGSKPRIPAGVIADMGPYVPEVSRSVVNQAAPTIFGVPRGKVLRGAGMAGLGLAGGAAGHQLAYSTGLSSTGPADVIANMVVPTEK